MTAGLYQGATIKDLSKATDDFVTIFENGLIVFDQLLYKGANQYLEYNMAKVYWMFRE